jgi:hypothetical protein
MPPVIPNEPEPEPKAKSPLRRRNPSIKSRIETAYNLIHRDSPDPSKAKINTVRRTKSKLP